MNTDTEDKFWKRVDKTSGCWNWTGAKSSNGYGTVGVIKLIAAGLLPEGTCRVTYVHRVAYMLSFGRHLKNDEHIDHLCRNRLCVRPDHLEAVTQEENNKRTLRNPRNGWEQRTACSNGHPYTENSTAMILDKRGNNYRCCRICMCDAQRRYKAKLKSKVAG